MTIKRALLLLIIAILIASAVNLPFATIFIKSRTDDKGEWIENVSGREAASHSWPTTTPHQHEWPPPTQWSESRAFGYRRISVWSSDQGRTQFGMQYELIGWPQPVFERIKMWWPRDDSKWQTKKQSDPAMRLYWPGVAINPLMVGGGLWLVLVCPLVIWANARRARRRRRGRCVRCGYDLRYHHSPSGTNGQAHHSESGGTFGCPECGWGREPGGCGS